MQKQETEEKDLFEDNSNYIHSLNIDEILKNKLQDVNVSLFKIGTSNYNLNREVSIFLENISSRETNIIIDILIKLLDDYKLCNDNPYFLNSNYFGRDNSQLIIAKSFNIVKASHDLLKIKEEVLEFNKFLIIASEDKFPSDFFTKRDLNSRVVLWIKNEDYTTDEILAKLKAKFNNNKIKYKISDAEFLNIIKKTINNDICSKSNIIDYLYNKALNAKVLDDVQIITKDTFDIGLSNKETIKLDDLVGLDNVKREIVTLKNYLAFQKRTGNNFQNNYLNMLFLGNPGTGKTTVARIYVKILYDLGYIKENKLVEIIPTDLMANYVGQTKDQTRKILKKAKGGVLFIDEAYLLSNVTYSDGFASFMGEAITELIKYMENPENVVIFAGYPIETRKIYDANPGIKSRICKEIIFDDYTSAELYLILKNNLSKIGFKITKKAQKELLNRISMEKQKKNFGNARFCNILMQQILMNYANRNTSSDTYEIEVTDTKILENQVFQIGFKE